jgi:hypothetical protein
MKKINVKYGIAQTINDILGNDPNTPKNPGEEIELTYWSLQECLFENITRITKAIIGNSNNGRVMSGLNITFHNTDLFDISPGIGITKNGNIIYLKTAISNFSIQSLITNVKIYLLHKMTPIDPTVLPNAKGLNTTFTKKTGNENIVYDDMISCYGNKINTIISDIIYVSTDESLPTSDYIYLGEHIVGETTIKETPFRGFGPNDNDTIMIGNNIIQNLMDKSNGIHSINLSLFENKTIFKDDVYFGNNGQLTEMYFNDGLIIHLKTGGEYKEGITTLVPFKNGDGNVQNMRFINGIFVGVE